MKAFGTSAFAHIADSSRTLRDVCFVPWKRTFRKRFFLIAALPIWWGRSSGPMGHEFATSGEPVRYRYRTEAPQRLRST
jgi:hypothetical protein